MSSRIVRFGEVTSCCVALFGKVASRPVALLRSVWVGSVAFRLFE